MSTTTAPAASSLPTPRFRISRHRRLAWWGSSLACGLSVIGLALYALFNLALYALVPVTLTLPGIAGFILSVGMAVDANVLIFERVKEELRGGNTLIRSIDTGFSLAFSSIFDGHVTGLISCAALFFLGTGLVRGFAVTLAIGLLMSLFTALTCTRTLLRLLMSYPALRLSLIHI